MLVRLTFFEMLLNGTLTHTMRVSQITLSGYVLSAIFRNAQDAVHGDRRQQGRVLRHDLQSQPHAK
jgi:hypothetical protein